MKLQLLLFPTSSPESSVKFDTSELVLILFVDLLFNELLVDITAMKYKIVDTSIKALALLKPLKILKRGPEKF